MRAIRNGVLLVSTLGAIFTAEMVAGQAVDQIIAAEERRIQQAQASQNVIDGIVDDTRETIDTPLRIALSQLRHQSYIICKRPGVVNASGHILEIQ